MTINILSLLLLSFSVHASTCEDVQRSYIIGDYKKCSNLSLTAIDMTPECKYVASLCSIANYDYDNARYELSILSVPDKKAKFSRTNALALNSLVEVAYLKGDYAKARMLSSEINTVLSKRSADSYEYAVSEILLTRSYFDSKDSLSAHKRISMLKLNNMDPLIYSTVAP